MWPVVTFAVRHWPHFPILSQMATLPSALILIYLYPNKNIMSIPEVVSKLILFHKSPLTHPSGWAGRRRTRMPRWTGRGRWSSFPARSWRGPATGRGSGGWRATCSIATLQAHLKSLTVFRITNLGWHFFPSKVAEGTFDRGLSQKCIKFLTNRSTESWRNFWRK